MTVKVERARLDADKTAKPKTRLVRKHRVGDRINFASGATHIEAEDGTQIPLQQHRAIVEAFESNQKRSNEASRYVLDKLRAENARLRSALMVELVNPLDTQWECQRCGALAPLDFDVDAIKHRGKDCPLSPDCDLP